MKRNEITPGFYLATVRGRKTVVKVLTCRPRGGWTCQDPETGHIFPLASSQLRQATETPGQPGKPVDLDRRAALERFRGEKQATASPLSLPDTWRLRVGSREITVQIDERNVICWTDDWQTVRDLEPVGVVRKRMGLYYAVRSAIRFLEPYAALGRPAPEAKPDPLPACMPWGSAHRQPETQA